MVVKLLPEQVAAHWDFLKEGLEETVAPVALSRDEYNASLLSALLGGLLECWVHLTEDGEIDLVVVTTITSDRVSLVSNLLIYAVFTPREVSFSTWLECFNTLSKYAEGKGCCRIVGYTEEASFVQLAKRLSSEAKAFTFVTLPIPRRNQ